MLNAAERVIIVTGENVGRSKSMDTELQNAISKNGFQPSQALLPPTASPRLDSGCLPLAHITGQDFLRPALLSYSQYRNAEYFLQTKM